AVSSGPNQTTPQNEASSNSNARPGDQPIASTAAKSGGSTRAMIGAGGGGGGSGVIGPAAPASARPGLYVPPLPITHSNSATSSAVTSPSTYYKTTMMDGVPLVTSHAYATEPTPQVANLDQQAAQPAVQVQRVPTVTGSVTASSDGVVRGWGKV